MSDAQRALLIAVILGNAHCAGPVWTALVRRGWDTPEAAAAVLGVQLITRDAVLASLERHGPATFVTLRIRLQALPEQLGAALLTLGEEYRVVQDEHGWYSSPFAERWFARTRWVDN